MPSQITQLSLHELQTYALKYFPKDFKSLPKLEAMKFETLSDMGDHKDFKAVRLHIGYNDKGRTVYAYITRAGIIYYGRGGGYPLWHTLDGVNDAVDGMELFEPFRTVVERRDIRLNKFGSVNVNCATILQYYFALQGVVVLVQNPYLLISFELVCILVANSKRVSKFVKLNTKPRGIAQTTRRYQTMTRSDMQISQHGSSMIHQEMEDREEGSECVRRADAGIDAVAALPLSSPIEPSNLMRSPLPETDSHSSSSSEVLPKNMDAGRKRKCTDFPNDQNGTSPTIINSLKSLFWE